MFNKISFASSKFQKEVYKLTKSYIKSLISHYKKSPEDFKGKLDIEELASIAKQ